MHVGSSKVGKKFQPTYQAYTHYSLVEVYVSYVLDGIKLLSIILWNHTNSPVHVCLSPGLLFYTVWVWGTAEPVDYIM